MERNAQPQNSTFEIKDLAISAYLYASSEVSFIGKKRTNDGSIIFLFTPKEVAEELVRKYWSQQAPPIQPKQLFSAQRDLKDMIFSG